MSDPTRRLHMVGNAHLDPVWLWQWPEGYAEVRATFRSALDRMAEDPEFRFSQGSAACYAWLEEAEPETFEEIRRRVEEGRWEIVGGWWVEPDCNLPGGESLARQALHGQRFFASRFGSPAVVGANVDPFGHAATLPQLLAGAGLDAYVFLRPGPHEKSLPPVFWWEAPDGSRVLAARIPNEYCAPGGDIGGHVDKVVAHLGSGWTDGLCLYGVGNHGGGPTRANLASIRRIRETDQSPDLLFSTLGRFVATQEMREDLPVVRGELQHHAVGCYSAHSGIKRWNRRAESILAAAEAWASVSERVAHVPYPGGELNRAWKQVLFNQFHDTLGGTAIEPAYDDARDQLGEATSIATRAHNVAIQSLSRLVNLPADPGTFPILVFNPHAWPVRTVVELEFGGLKPTDGVVDEAGAAVPFQATQSYATVSAWRSRMALAVELPPLGYRTYRVVPDTARLVATTMRASDTVLENEHLRLEFDPRSGRIVHLALREDGRDIVDLAGPDRPRAIVVDDTSDTWGHRRLAYRDEIGAFEARRISLVESGPVRAILRVESRHGASELIEDFVLAAGARVAEVRVILDWRETSKLLKLRFPTCLGDAEATYEIPYGVVGRPANGEEEPAQRWVDASGTVDGEGRCGLAVLNDGKYSFDVVGGEIGVTAVRSPIYAHHEPATPKPDARYAYQDQGLQRFALALLPHRGDWRDAGATREAAVLNGRPSVLIESFHDGPLAQTGSYLQVEPDHVVAGAVKLAEDGDDLVVRVVETAGRAGPTRIELPAWERQVAFDIRPFEIRTFRIPRDPSAPPVETDLLERPLAP